MQERQLNELTIHVIYKQLATWSRKTRNTLCTVKEHPHQHITGKGPSTSVPQGGYKGGRFRFLGRRWRGRS